MKWLSTSRLKCLSACVVAVFLMQIHYAHANNTVSLDGEWQFKLDPENVGEAGKWFAHELPDKISLPGTTDEGGYGKPEVSTVKYNALVRPHFYVGKAWYQRDIHIPKEWDGKHIALFLERAHWISEVWINEQKVGSEDSLSTPHEYDLTNYLTSGTHRLTIAVNNKYPFSLGAFASSVSEHTQSNWNGLVGRLELQARDAVWIDELRVYPNIKEKQALVRLTLHNTSNESVSGSVALKAVLDRTHSSHQTNNDTNSKHLKTSTVDFNFTGKETTIETIVPMGDDVLLWSEFSPDLYVMHAHLQASTAASNAPKPMFADKLSELFGMREVSVEGRQFTLNGEKIYLRGNLESCIFPLTGYPTMNESGWIEIMQTMKDHGLNHVRFHSWTPPEAAFSAASRVGMYLQPEGPRANIDNSMPARDVFIQNELLRINRHYGNHPSFMLMTSGNELTSPEPINANMVARAKQDDDRHLYSTTSGGHGMKHIQSTAFIDQYKVGSIRGFSAPSTVQDHTPKMSRTELPFLSHEVGQWATYPNISDISKYTGVLKPQNLIDVRKDLTSLGLLDQADDFFRVTAKHAALLYKEEVEVLLRTENHAGFQLLALHDYVGQGTAHVGLLNAFWEPKGGMSAAEFKRFSGPIVPLLRMQKRTYLNSESFIGDVEIHHYGPTDLNKARPIWTISDSNDKVIAKGHLPISNIPRGGRVKIGQINTGLSFVSKPQKLNVSITIEGTKIANDWDIWVYPDVSNTPSKNVQVFTKYNKGLTDALNKGESVLLIAAEDSLVSSIPAQFKTVFWSPSWWWTKPRGGYVNMSILTDPKHPVFSDFPTEEYTNWQWWDLLEKSNAIVLDDMPVDVQPLVQLVDNFNRNHKLANIIEVKVGKGKLLITTMDLTTDLDNRLAAKQLRKSLERYLVSDEFSPKVALTSAQLGLILK